MNFSNNCIFKLLRYTIKFVIDCSFNCRVFFNLTFVSNNRKCFELKCFCKKINKLFSKNENNINDFLMSFSIFRRYVFKKTFDEKNFIFIIEINMFANFKNFSTFSYKDIKIVLCRVFIFFRIHYFEKFLFLKFIDHDSIHQKSELNFKKFSNLDRFRLLDLFKKFDSLSFLFKLIEFDL
jgi:hypothetical protein